MKIHQKSNGNYKRNEAKNNKKQEKFIRKLYQKTKISGQDLQ